MNIFREMMNMVGSPISCDSYKLKENETLSEDGESIVCRDCGEVRRIKTYSNLYKTDIWTSANHDDSCLCRCDREKALEASKKRDEEAFRRLYDSEHFRSWIGERYVDVNLDELHKEGDKQYEFALKVCRRYVANSDSAVSKGQGIYMHSERSGTGKTTLMAGLRNALIAKQVKCVFINLKDLLNEAGRRGRDDYSDTLYNYSMFFRVPVLILDDIGMSKLNEDRYGSYVNDILYELMEKRCRNRLSTCFTSNYSPKQLENERGVDFKTVDRITELSTLVVQLGGESMRGQNNKNKDTNARGEKE